MNKRLRISNNLESYKRGNSMTSKDIGTWWITRMHKWDTQTTSIPRIAFRIRWALITLEKSQNMTLSTFIINLISAQSKQIILFFATSRDISQISHLLTSLLQTRSLKTIKWDQCQISWREMVTLRIWKLLSWPISGNSKPWPRRIGMRKMSLKTNGRSKSKKRNVENKLITYSNETEHSNTRSRKIPQI